MGKIYILGSINTDLVISTSIMPNEGETVTGNNFFSAHGGKGANQAVAAARLGGNVKFCGKVGDDVFGDDAYNSLKNERIDVSCVKKVKGIATGTAIIIVSNGDNRIILDPGANAKVNKTDVDEFLSDAKEGDIFLTQLEIPIKIVGYALEKAKSKKMFVVLNPAPANKEVIKYLKYCDLITPNEGELNLLGGVEKLLKEIPNVLVTLGGKGFTIYEGNKCKKYPCMKIKPVDTTAAGDTLCGGLVAMYSLGKSLEISAKFGSKAASIACTRLGAQPSIPFLNEVSINKDEFTK